MRLFSKDQSNLLFDQLRFFCGASEKQRDNFVYLFSKAAPPTEYRFNGSLGYGGKFRNNNNGVYVDCYQEDETPERLSDIEKCNEQIKSLGF